VKGYGVIGSAEFKRNVDAGNAIKRTLDVKKQIAESMHAGWRAFAPLDYQEMPTI
jgi:hypothetical protein